MIEYPEWLSEDGRKVFDHTLPKIENVSAETLEMLAAYADAIVNLRKLRGIPDKAAIWRRAMLYARNGLGIGPKVFVDLLDILLDWQFMDYPVDEPPPYGHLKQNWQLPETMRPGEYELGLPSSPADQE